MTKNLLKPVILFSASLSLAFGVEVQILPEKKIDKEISKKETEKIISMLKKQGFYIKEPDAKRVVYENRLLANEFLKNPKNRKIVEDTKEETRLQLEKKFADLLVKQHLDKIKLNDDITKSYYIKNRKKFEKNKEVSFDSYEFEDFEEAYKVFKGKTPAQEPKSATIPYENLHPLLKQSFERYKNTTPPIFINGRFYVFKNIKTTKKSDYESVKEDIRAYLLNQTISKKRAELIKKLKEKTKR